MITASIAVNKIDKSKFFIKKNGDKMLDIVLIETPNSKYDTDYMVCQSQTKEERAKKQKSVILGNARIVQSKGNQSSGGQAKTEGGSDDW